MCGCFLVITVNAGVFRELPCLWVFYGNYHISCSSLVQHSHFQHAPAPCHSTGLSHVFPPFLFCLQIRHCSSKAALPAMLPATVAALVAELHTLASWTSSFLFSTDQGYVDLSLATGPEAMPLAHLPYQPQIYPPGTSYRFDPEKYLGKEAKSSILEDVSASIGDCHMYSRGETSNDSQLYTTHSMRCSFTDKNPNYSDALFVPETFSKKNTITERIKRKHSQTGLPTDRMLSAKMKQPKLSPLSLSTAVESNEHQSPPKNRRTQGLKALTRCSTCDSTVSLRNYHESGHWYLSSCSSLCHVNHHRLDPVHKRVSRDEITPLETERAQIIYDEGGNLGTVTRVMNQLRKKRAAWEDQCENCEKSDQETKNDP